MTKTNGFSSCGPASSSTTAVYSMQMRLFGISSATLMTRRPNSILKVRSLRNAELARFWPVGIKSTIRLSNSSLSATSAFVQLYSPMWHSQVPRNSRRPDRGPNSQKPRVARGPLKSPSCVRALASRSPAIQITGTRRGCRNSIA